MTGCTLQFPCTSLGSGLSARTSPLPHGSYPHALRAGARPPGRRACPSSSSATCRRSTTAAPSASSAPRCGSAAASSSSSSGPTGCGKSTCIRLLTKELEASAGEILIAGKALADVSRGEGALLRRNIGVVFQDYKLLPNRTVYDNVAYSLQVIGEPRQEIRRKVPDILRLVGLSTKLHNYPDELSGGEQQRVSIARAFVNHPPLLLADEPTGNLDPETSIGIMQLIYRINRTGTTVVVATHDSAMVDKMRRRVIELREGRIIRDELSGLYRPDESTTEFAVRLRGEMGVGAEGHPN